MKKFFTLLAIAFVFNVTKSATVFPIATNPAAPEISDEIAFDGTNYIVGLLQVKNQHGALQNISGINGALIGSQILFTNDLGFPNGSALAFGRTNYLVAWSDYSISNAVDMSGQFISRSGAMVGTKFKLLSTTDYNNNGYGFQTVEAMASDGTNYLVVWQDQNDSSLYGQLVTPAGTLSGSEFLISSQHQNGSSAAVTFGKTNYLVVWQSNNNDTGTNNKTYGENVSRSGAAGSPFQISVTASTDQNPLAVAFDGTNYLVVWNWDVGTGFGEVTNWDIYGRVVSQNGNLPGNELQLVTDPGIQILPTLAFDGANYLMAWGDAPGGEFGETNSNIHFQFFNRSGSASGSEFTVFTAQGTNNPLVGGLLFDGSRYVMTATLGTVSRDTNGNVNGFPSGEVFGAFIPSSAPLVDTTKPTLRITYPTNTLTTNNMVFTFQGKAHDNVSVSNVLYSLNGGDWANAVSGNNWSNWTAQVTLTPGTNKFKAYAVDTSGNASVISNANVFYAVKVPLALAKVGKGKINGATNGQLFAIGRIVTLTTSNGVGYILTNWQVQVDGVTVISANKAMPFPMASNTMVTATFADVQKPVVTLTFPTNTLTTTNTTITVSGKAKDNTAVAGVYYSVAGSGWSLATTLNNWTNWTVPNIPLILGANIIQIYASDTFGLNSSVTVVNVARNPVPLIKKIYKTITFDNPQARIAFDGTNYLVAYADDQPGNRGANAQFVSQSGNLIGSPLNLNPGGQDDPPCLAFDGANYLAAWGDYSDQQAGIPVRGAFVSPDGQVGSPMQFSQSTTVDNFGTMVFGGGVYFLTWSDSRNSNVGGNDDIYGALIDTGGNNLFGDFKIGANGRQNEVGQGAAAFDGTNFLATWGGASGKYSVLGRLISPSGAYVTAPFIIYTNSTLPAGETLQSVVYDGSKYLVMFSVGAGSVIATNWHNQGRFVMPDGTVLTNKVTFTTDVGPQIVPCGTFDGTRYLVTWNQGFNPFDASSVGSIIARFFDVNGKPSSSEFTLFSPAAGQTALWAPVLYDGTQYFAVGGLGQVLSPAPNLTFTNGVIKEAIISP